jgi:hypothetical protein
MFLVSNHQYQVSTNIILDCIAKELSGITNTQWCILMIWFLMVISHYCTLLVSNHQYEVSTNILDCIIKELSGITNTRWCILMIQFLMVIFHYCTLLLLNHQYQASTNIILDCIAKELSGYNEYSVMHLDDPILNADFPLLYTFYIEPSVSGID